VGGKILDSVATCLASKLTVSEAPKLSVVEEAREVEEAEDVERAAAQAGDRAEAIATGRKAGEATAAVAAKPKLSAAPDPETEPIDLLSYAGPSVIKRAAPLLALAAAVLAFVTLRRRHR
jgi:hypothetical protein